MVSPTKKILLTTLLTNACRVLLAFLFMVSGFVKAVDPIGFLYKLREYALTFDITLFSDAWLLFFALVIVGVEFIAGFLLLIGAYRKPVAVFAFVVMLFYTPFTLYLLLENPVSDCGCFGDAMQLTNLETFIKNLFLLFMAAVVCFNTSLYRRCISNKSRWLAVLFVFFYTIFIEGISLWHLPVIDFRPFAVGTNLREAVIDMPAQYESIAVYEKNGEQRDFAAGCIPGAEWNYIGSRNKLVEPARPATVNDFALIDIATDYDIAEDVLADTGYVAILVMESLENADESRVDKINDLYDYSINRGFSFYAVTSSDEEAVALWCKRTGAEYPLYWADNDMLKTMVRANPGLLLLKDGVILDKWKIDDVPEVDTTSVSATLFKSDWLVNCLRFMRGWHFWSLSFILPVAFILFVDVFACMGKKDRGKNAKSIEENTALQSKEIE